MPVSIREMMAWLSGGGCEGREKESWAEALEATSAVKSLIRGQVHLLLTSDLCSAMQLRGL